MPKLYKYLQVKERGLSGKLLFRKSIYGLNARAVENMWTKIEAKMESEIHVGSELQVTTKAKEIDLLKVFTNPN